MSSGKRTHTCVVCGRPFPDGQGIVISVRGKVLEFHSSRCASKFLRLMLERGDSSCLDGLIVQMVKEFREANEKRRESKGKVIA